ncbi:MAG TPA: aminotransferase class I/II-fold pyridoxal phosphate-dependent enzyme, partial [Blastocatellia bacterium]|nr:aminotransferase class I/II-fold pyridoxal phosphate-dependent enzyme [Blastocatellia bacterium]
MVKKLNKDFVPFYQPYVAGKELEYLRKAIESRTLAADGAFTKECSSLLEGRFDIKKLYLTPSCTSALEMAAMLCDLAPGDEVIMPSFTFTSTANAVVLRGAKPVFVDV